MEGLLPVILAIIIFVMVQSKQKKEDERATREADQRLINERKERAQAEQDQIDDDVNDLMDEYNSYH
jgi:uncharacterized protein YlxW (UPF0749 family)